MISLRNISKSYSMGTKELQVLKGVSLSIERGEMVSIIGKSGSGKSTLLNMIGMLDSFDSGEYFFDGNHIHATSEAQAAHYRNRYIGFVFQTFHLIGTKSALENVALPLIYKGVDKARRLQMAQVMLDKVGLGDRVHHLPNELSGGQKQRVAIARALVTDADLILADEPTGALDSKTSEEIMSLLWDINSEGKTVLIVTHEKEIADSCRRKIEIVDGQILGNE